MAIPDWPQDERPREKLLRHGAAALTDAELLALFLRVGVRGRSAVDMGRDLLARFGSLTRLFNASREDIAQIRGMGLAKYAQLQAVLEMARRALTEQMQAPTPLHRADLVKDYLRLSLSGKSNEVFTCLFMDARNQLIVSEDLFQGSLTETSVYPREVVKKALSHNAASAIFAHNHPGGAATPSPADERLTRQLVRALALIDVVVIDHLVVGRDNVFSFAENGLLQG